MMRCHKCGHKVTEYDTICKHCGTKISKTYALLIKTLAILAVGVCIAGYYCYALELDYIEHHPVLNSPADITDELISKIADNKINSLTINYEFTRCINVNENKDDWEKYRLENNPFWMANRQKALKSISFNIKLSPDIHSLACAFYGMKELEFVNLEDTSNVTNMR